MDIRICRKTWCELDENALKTLTSPVFTCLFYKFQFPEYRIWAMFFLPKKWQFVNDYKYYLCQNTMIMNEIIFLVEESPEGGYTAKALGQSIFTEADSISDLKEMIRDAVLCHFDEGEHPKIVRMHIVKDEVFSLAS